MSETKDGNSYPLVEKITLADNLEICRILNGMWQVAGVIIGTRLGITNHRKDNTKVSDLKLDSDDISSIDEITARSNDLFNVIGDCGDEYR